MNIPHILIVTSWYPSEEHPFAGAFVQAQAHALADAGCLVGVLSVEFCSKASHTEHRDDCGVKVFQHCAQALTPNQKRMYWFGGYRREQKRLFELYVAQHGVPDIVNIEGLWPAGRLIPWLSQKDIPCVVTEHSEEYLAQSSRKLLRAPFMLKGILSPLAKRAAGYSAPSHFLAQSLAQTELVESPQSVRIIPNVVPNRDAKDYPEDALLRFVHVSSFSPAKNMERMLDALERVAAEVGAIKLILIGDSEFRETTEALVHERELDEYVDFCGYQNSDEISQQLNNSSAAVLSSDYETFSSFAAEALMAGRPVLTTPCGGPEEFIDNTRGIISPNMSASAFARSWQEMALAYTKFNPAELHQYAAEHFSPEAVAAQFLEWYQGVLKG